MPRPLNVNGINGGYPGLGATGDTPYVTSSITYLDSGLNCPGDPGCNNPGNWVTPDSQSLQGQINSVWDYIDALATPSIDTSLPAGGGGVTVGSWISQNKMMLLFGGVIGLVLFARR